MSDETIPENVLYEEEKRFRKLLEPNILLIKGLVQTWNCFVCTEEMAKYFYDNFIEIPFQAKTALTKAIVIEYIKPWQKNNGRALSSVRENTKYSFIDSVIRETHIHKSIDELRQRLVAHTNEEYESISIGFRGADIPNLPTHGERAPRTLSGVRFPVVPVIKMRRGIWWIDCREKVGEIQDHARKCKDATQIEIRRRVEELRDICLKNMHVLERCDDIVGFSPLEKSESIDSVAHNFDVNIKEEFGVGLPIGAPRKTRIGDEHINSLIAVIAPGIRFTESSETVGPGFVFRILGDENSSRMKFNISFPRFPDQ